MASLTTAATKTLVKHSTESILFGFDFGPLLNSGETLSSVTVTGSPSGLTIASAGSATVKATSWSDELTGETIAANEGAQIRISGGTTATDYTLTATATTSAGNTRVLLCTLQVRDT